MKRRKFLKFGILFFQSKLVFSQKSIPKIQYDTSTYCGVFFEPNKHNQLCFLYTNDVYHWNKSIYLTYQSNPLTGRDPSIIYYKDKWLLALTGSKEDKYDLSLFISSDLSNWKAYEIDLGGNESISSAKRLWDNASIPTKIIWAPEFVVDKHSDLYIVAAVQTGFDRTTNGKDKFFELYMSKCTISNGSYSFTKAKRVKVLDSNRKYGFYSRIDPFIIYDNDNNRYILAAKRENYGVIDFFVSSDLYGDYIYTGTLELHSINKKMDIEGPSIIYNKNTKVWCIYFDSYYLNQGIMYVKTSNFTEFSQPLLVQQNTFSQLRHGTIRSR